MNKNANIVEKMVLATIGHEKRQKIAIPVFSILVALIVGGIVIALLGHNPFYAFIICCRAAALRRKLPTQEKRA